jgi:hypothetical protein
MKNFIGYIYKDGEASRQAHLINILKAQVENSLRLGWKKEDIVFVTNFEFEHMGVTPLINMTLHCDWSVWTNKHYSLCFAMRHFEDNWWVHDHDMWQLQPFEFPKFESLLMLNVIDIESGRASDSSFFIKKSSLMEEFVKFCDNNRHIMHRRGEIFWHEFIRGENRMPIPYDVLDWSYGMRKNKSGRRKFRRRYNACDKPIKAIHARRPEQMASFFRGQNRKSFSVDDEFFEIYRKYVLA